MNLRMDYLDRTLSLVRGATELDGPHPVDFLRSKHQPTGKTLI